MGKVKQIKLIGGRVGLFPPRSDPLEPRRKYPQVSSERERSRYAAVFQDQYTEFLELQQEVGSALAKLQQLETLLNSLPRPRSQVSPSRHPWPTALPGGGPWALGPPLGPGLWAPSSSGLVEHHSIVTRVSPGSLHPRVTLSEPQFPHPSLSSASSEHPQPLLYSQKEANVAARVWREFEKKQTVSCAPEPHRPAFAHPILPRGSVSPVSRRGN